MGTQVRGEWVVGLNPDDRMPNDWLRMVARVFASFRKAPLKDSIVVYIDGFELTLESHVNFNARVKIGPGQAFVDDQFIGFIENSYYTFDTTALAENIRHCIVLHYRWLNQFPPPEPSFELIPEQNVNREEMLILGYINCTRDPNTGACNLTLEDSKTPWYKEWIGEAVRNAEIDDNSQLPYIVSIKSGGNPNDGGSSFPDDPLHPENEEGTIDIGWAIDFHHDVGNNVNYNVRLHTNKQDDGELFLNNRKLISEIDPNNTNNPDDPFDAGDKYISMGNNVIVLDEKDGLYPLGNTGSDSGKSVITLAASRINTSPLETEGFGASSLSFDLDSMSSSWTNRTDFHDPTSVINELKLTNNIDEVTINGKPIWHSGNLQSTGKNIMFVGEFNGPPTTRPDGTALEDGDTYYDIGSHAYFYYQVDTWVQVGRSDAMKQYEFTASEGQQNVSCEYNPDFIWIGVSGVQLSKKDYIATDGQSIFFNTPLRQDESVTIFSVLSGESFGVKLKELADVQLMNLNNGQTVVWDAVLQKWVNHDLSAVTLDTMSDVDTSSKADGDVLVWDQSTQKWVTQTGTTGRLVDLSDTDLNGVNPGDSIIFNGSEWQNKNIMPAGSIITWAADNAPDGFLECDGSAISRTVYSALFSAIGTKFGGGNGSTTFNIPNVNHPASSSLMYCIKY